MTKFYRIVCSSYFVRCGRNGKEPSMWILVHDIADTDYGQVSTLGLELTENQIHKWSNVDTCKVQPITFPAPLKMPNFFSVSSAVAILCNCVCVSVCVCVAPLG